MQKAKSSKVKYVCKNCNSIALSWQGKCFSCQSWDSLEEVSESSTSLLPATTPSTMITACQIKAVNTKPFTTGLSEWDNVFGGGIMPGSFSVLTGDPGVGKSTVLLQIADRLSQKSLKVCYFSSEESLSQIKPRLERLGLGDTQVKFAHEKSCEKIISTLQQEQPHIAIIDSIQNCTLTGSTLTPGGPSYLRQATEVLLEQAKQNNWATIATGHITKEGIIAGPKVLEHLVDAVFYLQNQDNLNCKILRSVKNRFGPVDEVGFFQMTGSGLEQVCDINQRLLQSSSTPAPGTIFTLAHHGSRSILLELQALCVPTKFAMPQRIISGIDPKRVLIIAAILEKFLNLRLSQQDIFFQVAGSLKVKDSNADLAIAAALVSSYFKRNLPATCLAIGQISLTGQVRLDATPKPSELKNFDKVFLGSQQDFASQGVIQVQSIFQLAQLISHQTAT